MTNTQAQVCQYQVWVRLALLQGAALPTARVLARTQHLRACIPMQQHNCRCSAHMHGPWRTPAGGARAVSAFRTWHGCPQACRWSPVSATTGARGTQPACLPETWAWAERREQGGGVRGRFDHMRESGTAQRTCVTRLLLMAVMVVAVAKVLCTDLCIGNTHTCHGGGSGGDRHTHCRESWHAPTCHNQWCLALSRRPRSCPRTCGPSSLHRL